MMYDPGSAPYRNFYPRRGRTGYHFISKSGPARYDPRARVVTYGRRAASSAKLWSGLGMLAGFGSFIQQITEADISYAVSTGYWDKMNSTQKIEEVLGKAIGRITGWSPWPLVTGPGTQTINPAGMLNKWTGLGIASLAYSWLGHSFKLPARGPVKKIGTGLLFGGVIGGLFDDAQGTNSIKTNQNVAAKAGANAMNGVYA